MHADPKDAVNIFVDTKCTRALGMHWVSWLLLPLLFIARDEDCLGDAAWGGTRVGEGQ
jgi:N-acyl-phosphatidylethanolamine-hydrolysing phospholipase D